MNESLAKHYLKDALSNFRAYKKLAEKSFAQVSDEEFFRALDEESNSIAVIIKHIYGNMFSRWTDFLTTDGEKPTRQRDMEFVMTPDATRDDVMREWERGWQCVFDALEPLEPEDFEKKILIRGEEHSLIEAINRQLAHYAYHTGQIVFLAKHFRSADWQTLSIPRNKSEAFNTYLTEQAQSGAARPDHRFDASQDFTQEIENKKQ